MAVRCFLFVARAVVLWLLFLSSLGGASSWWRRKHCVLQAFKALVENFTQIHALLQTVLRVVVGSRQVHEPGRSIAATIATVVLVTVIVLVVVLVRWRWRRQPRRWH